MFSFIMTFLVAGLIISTPAQAGEKAAAGGDMNPAKPKSQYNTHLYEAEEAKDDSKSFTGKVRVIRDISDDIEVFFEGEKTKGIYSLSRSKANFAAMLKSLEASRKAGGPTVSVTADADKNIKSVELNKANSGHSGFVPPTDPNQKWDFGKLPD